MYIQQKAKSNEFRCAKKHKSASEEIGKPRNKKNKTVQVTDFPKRDKNKNSFLISKIFICAGVCVCVTATNTIARPRKKKRTSAKQKKKDDVNFVVTKRKKNNIKNE